MVFTVAVSEDRTWSHIGIAGRRSDGETHVQIVQSGRGTDWVAERVAELVDAWSPRAVALDPASPAGSLIPDLAQHTVTVETLNGREVTQACGAFLDAVNQGSVHHGGQRQLNVSIGVARKRTIEGGAFQWRSSDPKIDIAPLRAVTLALFVLEQQLALPKKRSGRAAFL